MYKYVATAGNADNQVQPEQGSARVRGVRGPPHSGNSCGRLILIADVTLWLMKVSSSGEYIEEGRSQAPSSLWSSVGYLTPPSN